MPTPSPTPAAVESPETTTSPQDMDRNGGATGDGSNFNAWDLPEQQQTTASWVLNTNTKKIHYPNCRDVKKISPENYSTSNASESDLLAQGYTVCKHCH